jgi:hypothetical protein
MPVLNQPSLIGGTMLVGISQWSKIEGSGAGFAGASVQHHQLQNLLK